MEGLEKIVMRHPFFSGLAEELGPIVSGCARNVVFVAGTYLFHEYEAADEFFLVREGSVAVESLAPGQAPAVFLTLGQGEIVGLSWLAPPYRWTFDARAVARVHAIGIDARCLRAKCEADHHLGYELMKRFLAVLLARLHATRLQALDVYRRPEQ